MNIACPECSTLYRVDPDRVPAQGVRARCRECGTVVRIDANMVTVPAGEHITAHRVESPGPRSSPAGEADRAPEPQREPDPDTGHVPMESPREMEDGVPEATSEGGNGAPVFGPQDPDTRARRLARALVSDIKVYNMEKWEAATAAGTLRKDLRDEILKSWDEYVEQVGTDMAKKTPHFRNALNEILARGNHVF